MLVGWSGSTAVAAGQGEQSAFATSVNDGQTFNDISLIDCTFNTIDDFAVSPDGSNMYVLTTDTTGTGFASLWRKDNPWARVLTLPTTGNENHIVRVAPDDWNSVYLGQLGTTLVAYTDDGGETTWKVRSNAGVAVADMAVESATTVYALSAAGSVSKTTDAGFIWGTAKATTLGNGATIVSLSPDNLIVGGTTGNVAYSTNGNSTWTKITPTINTATGNVQVTADGLADGDHIYAASDAVNGNVYRWTIGTSTSWSDIITGTLGTATGGAGYQATGIALMDGVLYVLAFDAGGGVTGNSSSAFRTLSPTTAGSTTAWSAMGVGTGTVQGALFDNTIEPQCLRMSAGSNKLWAADNALATAAIYSYTDTVTGVGPTLTGPVDGLLLTVNVATGRTDDVVYAWDRLSLATAYQLQIAYDSAFTQLAIGTIAVASTSSAVVSVNGPWSGTIINYAPATTYYWRVRMNAPVLSPWSEVRMFTTTTLSPWIPEINSPMDGATDVRLRPTFAWTMLEGADQYELEIATNSQFQDAIKSLMLDATVYGMAADLEYSTTYYVRVRGLKTEGAGATFRITERGEWINTVFTTMDEPPPPVEPPPPDDPPIIVLPEAETPVYVWVIIGIGGVLIIAVIVLIVRTRRQV
jgi:hypothetical protein